VKRPPRLFWQQLPGYLLPPLVILVLLGWGVSSVLRQVYYDQKRESLEQQANLLLERFELILLAPDTGAVDRWCKAVGRRGTTRVTAILPGGKVIGDSDENPAQMDYHNKRPEVLEAMAGRTASANRYSRTLMQPMMYVALPLKANGQVRAVLRTSAPISEIEEILAPLHLKLALLGAFFILLAVGICHYAARRLRRPMEAVRQGADAFTDNAAGPRLPPCAPAELDAVGQAVNRMAAGLGERIDELVAQSNEYEAVLSSMVEGVIAVDIDERLLWVNPAAVDILQINPARLKGRSVVEVVRSSRFQRFVSDALESGSGVSGDVIMHLEGERIIHIQCAPLRDADDRRIGTLLVLNDVTQVRHLEKVRQDFVANASHEIRTPLTAIKGFVETLVGGASERPAEAQRFLKIISNHVNRLEAILEDLLALARLEQAQGKDQLQREEHLVSDLVKTALQLIQPAADGKQIRIEVVLQKEGLTATVDASLLEQALVNLIDNAVKYSPSGSTVTVESGASETGVFVRVIDQGPGIAKKHQARLFERFYRIDKARSRQLGGTGLGLAIVKHILTAHGGSVSLESTPGKGSCFTLHLPRHPAASPA